MLRHADNMEERIDHLIATLKNRKQHGKYVLVTFLEVMSERQPQGDTCVDILWELAQELALALEGKVVSGEETDVQIIAAPTRPFSKTLSTFIIAILSVIILLVIVILISNNTKNNSNLQSLGTQNKPTTTVTSAVVTSITTEKSSIVTMGAGAETNTNCPTLSEAQTKIGSPHLIAVPIGTKKEFCAFTLITTFGMYESVNCPIGWICVLTLADKVILVEKGNNQRNDVIAGTWRFVNAYQNKTDSIYRLCDYVQTVKANEPPNTIVIAEGCAYSTINPPVPTAS
jgi:hypothetical protein